MIHHGITYAEIEGFRPLLLDLYVPDGASDPPVVVWIHGGGFQWGDRRWLPETMRPDAVFATLTGAGIACATIDYRLAGEAIWPAQREDVLSAIDFLRSRGSEFGVDGSTLGVWGESAGGHLAVMAGLKSPSVTAVVGWYPLTDMTVLNPDADHTAYARLIGGAPAAFPERAAEARPINHVGPDAPPFLLVHGVDDATLPLAQSERLHEALLAAGVESVLRPVDGAGHCFEGYDDVEGLVALSVAFLARRLGC